MLVFNLGPAIAAARAFAAQHQLTFKVSHGQEVMASLFGYNTYAALLMDVALAPEGTGLSAAEHYIINPQWGRQRSQDLGLTDDVAACCQHGAQKAFAPHLFASVDDFWHALAQGEVTSRIYDDATFSGLMAEQAHVSYDPDGFELDAQSGTVWQARDTWEVTTSGAMQGSLDDEEGSDVLPEETFAVWGRVVYRKAGRSGLILARVDLSPQAW